MLQMLQIVVLLNYSSKKSQFLHKYYIDNQSEMFLEHQILIIERFLKDHVTDAENSASITGIKYSCFKL